MEATRDQWQAQGILQQETAQRSPATHVAGIWPTSRRAASWAFVVRGGEGQFWYRASAAQTAFTPLGPAPVGGVQHPLSRHLASIRAPLIPNCVSS